jgi:hypothetical protein
MGEEFKTQLEQLGFRTEQNQFADPSNMLQWLAYRKVDTIPHRLCDCNEKCLQLVIKPYLIKIPNSDSWYDSCEVEIVGEHNQLWYKFMVYSIKHTELIERLDQIEQDLIGAWESLTVKKNVV